MVVVFRGAIALLLMTLLALAPYMYGQLKVAFSRQLAFDASVVLERT